MNTRVVSIIGAIAASLAISVGSGCDGGSDDSETAANLTKAEFIAKADALCQQVEEDRGKAITAFYKKQKANTANELGLAGAEKMVRQVAIPPLKSLGQEVEEVGPPAGEKADVEEVVAALDRALVKVEKKPMILYTSSPFDEAQKLASAYGFKTCFQY